MKAFFPQVLVSNSSTQISFCLGEGDESLAQKEHFCLSVLEFLNSPLSNALLHCPQGSTQVSYREMDKKQSR